MVNWMSTVNSTIFVLYIILISVIIMAIILFIFYWFFTFNITVRIRKKTNSYDQIIDTKGKIIKQRDGVECLIYRTGLTKRQKLPLPPPEAISINKKGRTCIEIEDDGLGAPRYMVRETNERIFKPFDSNDKVFHINEFQKVLERKSKKTWMQIVGDAVPFIALVIIFALLIFGWGEVVEPFNEAGKINADIALKQKETMQIFKEIINKEQILSDDSPNTDIMYPDPKPPE